MKIDDYIRGFMGPIDIEQPFGLALWANRKPGDGFLLHATLSEICTHQKPCIIIDDYLPMAIFRRSQEEQRKINEIFLSALLGNYSTIQLMSSSMTSSEYFKNVIVMLNKITFCEFMRCLPEKKLTQGMKNIATSEVLHTAAELFAFEWLKSADLKTIIIPQFAQSIVSLHRNISLAPLSAIVTSNFAVGTDFEKQNQELRQLADELITAIKKKI